MPLPAPRTYIRVLDVPTRAKGATYSRLKSIVVYANFDEVLTVIQEALRMKFGEVHIPAEAAQA